MLTIKTVIVLLLNPFMAKFTLKLRVYTSVVYLPSLTYTYIFRTRFCRHNSILLLCNVLFKK